ncbi:UBC-like protein [Xylariaceae sp. FL1272]|nr:UBC-like protein [Xylariaceae sp. FL1272]
MADQSMIRITKELGDIQKNSDLSLAVALRDTDVRNIKALIIGPHETPYEFGFFEFNVKFGKNYPEKSPSVSCVTTNGGRCRFNPNIYASGKVCLSILGTWRGEPGEEWSPAQGLESILLSIQSLMSSNPYENEPGFDTANEPSDKQNQKHYINKIRHETLRISVIQKLEEFLSLNIGLDPQTEARQDHSGDEDVAELEELDVPWEPFKDLYKIRFLWYYDSYLESIDKSSKENEKEVKDGASFTRMPFEGSSNTMEGKFNYTELKQRLQRIKAALDAEPTKWAVEGASAQTNDLTVAVNLTRQFEQVKESFRRGDMPHNVELEDNNPFVWTLTYFGRPMTNLDGGMFKIRLNFSPRFPEEQPRARLLTPIFHHRVTSDGIPCYTPNRSRTDDVRQHIDAIFKALEEENPPYDPRVQVHPEAHKLYWGGADGRKLYNRRLRRSVQDSLDSF